MPIINIVPTKDHPMPYDAREETPNTFIEELEIAAATVEMQEAMGAFDATLELSPDDQDREKRLLDEVVKKQKSKNLTLPNTAFAAAAFLQTYGRQLAFDAAAARSAITNKLMEIANCGETKYELKALELLGKHSDIGLFTDRSEITVNYKDPESLENAIKERVKRLLNAEVIDVLPLGRDLDEELEAFKVGYEEAGEEE
jgi:hypothetical protein